MTKEQTAEGVRVDADVRQPKISMPYVAWRFLYWQKNGEMTYEQIDEMVASGEIIPTDEMVA